MARPFSFRFVNKLGPLFVLAFSSAVLVQFAVQYWRALRLSTSRVEDPPR